MTSRKLGTHPSPFVLGCLCLLLLNVLPHVLPARGATDDSITETSGAESVEANANEAGEDVNPPLETEHLSRPWSGYHFTGREQLAAIQTLIDREHFSPGVIDGVWGPKSAAALAAWQKKHGLPATGQPDRDTFNRLEPLQRAFARYTITSNDHAGLTAVPKSWRLKAQMGRLDHETVEERLAEKFHCSRAFLRYLNPEVDWPNPPSGTVLRVPNPQPHPLPRAHEIHISLSQKRITVLGTNGEVIALFPCSIGREPSSRPTGELRIVAVAENPTYYFDPAVFREDPEAQQIGRKLVIPPGPNNPVGVAWISLDLPGYGIHGTPEPEDIGKTESHGCFRLANWNAAKLIRMVSIGTRVIVED